MSNVVFRMYDVHYVYVGCSLSDFINKPANVRRFLCAFVLLSLVYNFFLFLNHTLHDAKTIKIYSIHCGGNAIDGKQNGTDRNTVTNRNRGECEKI